MVAVRTGFTPPPMPGMPAPMQPMMPMGGPGTFPAAPLPAGQTPVPAPMPPMPLAGMPPPPMRPPMAQPSMLQQKGSNAPRRRRFGDSLEGMLGRNMFAPQQRRPLPMPPQMMQQRMVAPGTPMMRTPPMGRGMPRPMREGGIVQYMQDGGTPTNVNQYATGTKPTLAEFMDATGADSSTAIDILYGSVGSNVDVRDFNKIMSSNNPIAAAREATRQMYTGGDAASLSTGTSQASVPGSGSSGVLGDSGYNYKVLGREVYLTNERGAPITGISPDRAANFGLTQADINQALAAAGVDMDSQYAQRFKNKGIEFNVQGSDDLLVDYSNLQRGRPQSGFSGGSSSSGGNGALSESNTASGVVSSGGANENMALYGPNMSGITATTSQFVQDPNTFQVTAPQGSTMTAVSPIGSIDLPAAPVEIDIYDYLSDPVFGSLSPIETPIEKNMGGIVPMQTNIAGQPHGLAYINQDEEALLRSFGGSGIMGPGGIPSYPPQGVTSAGGASDAPKTFDSGYKPITTNYKDDDDDDKPSSYSAFDDDYEDYTPTSAELNQQLSDAGQTNITRDTSNVNFGTTSSGKDFTTAAQADTDVSGAEFVAAGGLGTGDSGTPTNIVPISLGSDDPVVFTDIMGKTYDNVADRDRANLGYQQASYQQGSQALRGLSQAFSEYAGFGDKSDEERKRIAAEAYVEDPRSVSFYNLQNVPDIFSDMFNQPILPPKIGDGSDKDDKDDSDGTQTISAQNPINLEQRLIDQGIDPQFSLNLPPKKPKVGTGGSDKDDKSDPRLKLIPKDKDGNPVVDLEVLKNTGLLEIYLENLANPDERLNRTPQVPGAAQTQLLTDAFNMASKDPNFLEQVIGKVVKNLTLGAFDPNERNRETAQAILDAYEETGTFAYDSEKDALDLSDTPEGRANFEKLKEMSAGDGQEIGTIGVYDAEGNIVGNKNTYVNTKDGVVVENIFDKLSSGDDDDGGSDTGTDTGVDTGHTVDDDGNIVCNTEGYIYNPETKVCEPPKEEEEVDGTPTINVVRGEDFDDVLKRVVVAAPDVAPISANVQPMQEGGMAGLNRAADNFLKALAG